MFSEQSSDPRTMSSARYELKLDYLTAEIAKMSQEVNGVIAAGESKSYEEACADAEALVKAQQAKCNLLMNEVAEVQE